MMTKLCEPSHVIDFDTISQHFTPVKVAKEDVCFGTLFRCECGKICVNDVNNCKKSTAQKHVMKKHSMWIPKAIPGDSDCKSKWSNGKSVEEEHNGVNKKQKIDTKSSNSQRVTKREDYLSWDDYFMSVAFLSAMRSKDPSTQVGACIVNPEKKIVGIGYNGFPQGCDDDELPWARRSESGSQLDTKYPYVCHAEMNAILNKNSAEVKGCSMYVALFPCNECAKLIIQSGIKTVVYYSDKYHNDWNFVASRRLMDMAGVKYIQHKMDMSNLTINFTSVF